MKRAIHIVGKTVVPLTLLKNQTFQRSNASFIFCVSHYINLNESCGSKRMFHSSKNLFARKRDLYEIMGLSRNATTEEINRRFKELAKKYHPDVNKQPDAKEKFAELNNAYQILRDPEKRRMYDMTGSSEAAEHGEGFPGGFGGRSSEDIFNEFFGSGGPFSGAFSQAFGDFDFGGMGMGYGGGNAPRAGAEVKKIVTVSLREAATGCMKDIRVNTAVPCTSCHGTGNHPSGRKQTCSSCRGRGRTTFGAGIFFGQQICSACNGSGYTIEKCYSCGGSGHKRESKNFEVRIPEGIEDGAILRIRGKGEPGINGGPPGDLKLEIRVSEDPVYRRKGNNLEIDTPITVAQAILGGEVQVPTIFGENVVVKIPQGTQNGDTVRVPGKGLKNRTTYKMGDLICVFKVQIPRYITEQQRKLIEEFDRLSRGQAYGGYNDSQSSSSNTSSFWNRFKRQ